MPKAKKKRKSVAYSEDDLQAALSRVKSGISIREAARTSHVPYTTLTYKSKGILSPTICKRGPDSILGRENEERLVQWILYRANNGFPITKMQLLNSVHALVDKMGMETIFPDNRPGKDWYRAFVKRHKLSARIFQNLSSGRSQVTEDKLRGWFTEVKEHLELRDMLIIDASRVFNCDETAFILAPKGERVLVRAGEKTVYNFINGDDKECLTTMICANAAGQLAPPMVMFACSRMSASLTASIPGAWGVGKSENGWVNSEACLAWVANCFYPWLKENHFEFPIILYLDGYKSHLTLDLSNFCREKDIILVSLYPNSTHIIQPLDVGFFRPLKAAWKKVVHEWRMEHDGDRLRRENFAPALKKAIASVDLQQILPNAFRTTGLYPFSPDAVNYGKYFKNAPPSASKPTENPPQLPEYVTVFEEEIGIELLQKFRAVEDGNTWTGDDNCESLFHMWLKLKARATRDDLKRDQETNERKKRENTETELTTDKAQEQEEMETPSTTHAPKEGANTETESTNGSEAEPLDRIIDDEMEEPAIPTQILIPDGIPTDIENLLLTEESLFFDVTDDGLLTSSNITNSHVSVPLVDDEDISQDSNPSHPTATLNITSTEEIICHKNEKLQSPVSPNEAVPSTRKNINPVFTNPHPSTDLITSTSTSPSPVITNPPCQSPIDPAVDRHSSSASQRSNSRDSLNVESTEKDTPSVQNLESLLDPIGTVVDTLKPPNTDSTNPICQSSAQTNAHKPSLTELLNPTKPCTLNIVQTAPMAKDSSLQELSSSCLDNPSKDMPMAFREALSWSISNPKKPMKRVRKIEHVPAVVTSNSWNNMFQTKANNKVAEEKEKQVRREERVKKRELRLQEAQLAQVARRIKKEAIVQKKEEERREKELKKMKKAQERAEKQKNEEELKAQKRKLKEARKTTEAEMKCVSPLAAKKIKQEILDTDASQGG